MSAAEFLAEIHRRFELVWVYDGTTLYLYDRTEAVREPWTSHSPCGTTSRIPWTLPVFRACR